MSGTGDGERRGGMRRAAEWLGFVASSPSGNGMRPAPRRVPAVRSGVAGTEPGIRRAARWLGFIQGQPDAGVRLPVTCSRCGALVDPAAEDRHTAWHQSLGA